MTTLKDRALEALAQDISRQLTRHERRVIQMAAKGPMLVVVEGSGDAPAARQNMRRRGVLHFGHADDLGRATVTLEPLGELVHNLIHGESFNGTVRPTI